MRRYVIAGNWKMNFTPSQATAFINEIKPMVAGKDNCDIVFCAPFVSIAAAMEAARELRGINPENGYAYFIFGQCYAVTPCTEDKIGGSSIYWAAYDAMAQAVNLLKDEPEVQKAAQQMMSAYRAAFPVQESCFFAELTAGDRYTILCGYAAGQTTTVRYR